MIKPPNTMSYVVSILKKPLNLSDHLGKSRSEYNISDMKLAQHYSNYQEIIEKNKVRPRLPSPPLKSKNTYFCDTHKNEMNRQKKFNSNPRKKKKKKTLRWSDATIFRSKSFDHLEIMRSSFSCNCQQSSNECHVTRKQKQENCQKPHDHNKDHDDTGIIKKSKSLGNLVENQRNKSDKECVRYLNCDSLSHIEYYDKLLGQLFLNQQPRNSKYKGSLPNLSFQSFSISTETG